MNTAKKRLRLGQANIGFWLLLSISIILFKTEIETYFIGAFIFLSIILQLPFDVFGAKKLYSHGQKNRKWIVQWFKGIIALSGCWGLLSFLIFLIQPILGFCIPVLVTMILIFQMHEKLIIFINGDKYIFFDVRNFKGKSLFLNCSENTFTGGVVYGFFKKTQIVPESWSSSPHLNIECFRRSLILKNKFVMRSFVFLTFWNLLGVLFGEIQGLYYSDNIGLSIICLSCWMTIWSFLALILMPRLSHSTVYAIDYLANKYDSVRFKKWIIYFAELIDENGDKNKLVQSVFYPIPSVDNRINSLKISPSFCFGNMARQNLFISWGVFNLSCRSVHCNIGRPVLWAFPPSA